jgi:hypothetical protein
VRYRVTPLFERVFGLESLSELPRLDDLGGDAEDRGRAQHVRDQQHTLPPPPVEQPIVTDVEFSFYLHLEVADRPGVLAQIAEILGLQGVSIKSVVQHGLGDEARLVMVMHPVLESKFRAAVDLIARLDFVRESPRVIRVIEEVFE